MNDYVNKVSHSALLDRGYEIESSPEAPKAEAKKDGATEFLFTVAFGEGGESGLLSLSTILAAVQLYIIYHFVSKYW